MHKIFLGMFSAMFVALVIVGCSSAAPTATPVPPKPATVAPTTAPTATTARPTSAPVQPTVAPTTVVPTTAPTATTARATSTPAQPTATPTAAQSSTDYNGEWNGTSSSDSPFKLSVENNQLTFYNLNYSGATGTCQSMSLSYANSLGNAPIKGKDFSAQSTFDDGDQITLVGSFKSNTELAGSFTIKGKTNFCGAFEVKGTFTAKNGGVASSSASNSAPIDYNASKNLRAFFDAINTKNADAAVALVNDTITFNIGSTIGSGKAALKTYLQSQISKGTIYTLSNLDDQGDSVDFSLKTGNGAVTDGNTAGFDDNGKIDFMVWK